MRTEGLSINLATIKQLPMREAVEACARHGIRAISPWREPVQEMGPAAAAKLFKDHGMRLTGYCRGGMFPAADAAGRQERIDDNKRMIDEAAVIGADCIVIIGGAIPTGSRDLPAAHRMVAEGLAAILPHARASKVPLALEALHPMYAADRACLNTLEHALDLCDQLGDGIGVVVDAYHLWWDPDLAVQIARAGKRIIAHHICDWLVPTRDMLTDRGMMGDGVIDLPGLRRMVEAAGYLGAQEVEIFSAENWWKRPADEVIRTAIERYNTVC